jgi:hypothetical protein
MVRAGESLLKLTSDLKQYLILNDFPRNTFVVLSFFHRQVFLYLCYRSLFIFLVFALIFAWIFPHILNLFSYCSTLLVSSFSF